MGKPKKGSKRGKNDDEMDDDLPADLVAKLNMIDDDEEEDIVLMTKPKKKEKKKNKMKIPLEVEDDDDDNEEGDDISQALGMIPSGSAANIGFQMLDMMSDEEKSEKESEDEIQEAVKQESKNKKKKKEKKQKKEKSPEDDDLDAVLAEIESAPAKKNKKKNKKKEVEDDLDAILAEIENGNEKVKTDTDMISAESANHVEGVTQDCEMKGTNKLSEAVNEDKVEEESAEDVTSTIKTAAQKRKEKREREKEKKRQEAAKKNTPSSKKEEVDEPVSLPSPTDAAELNEEGLGNDDVEDEDGKKKKKKDKKKLKKEEKEDKGKKKMGKSTLAAMQAALLKAKEDEERFLREEEEKIRLAEEAQQKREEQERIEKEKKEQIKQMKKEREQKLKAEGKWLTEKQKQDRRRALQMLEMMKQQGVEIPTKDENQGQKKRVRYDHKPKRKQQQAKTLTTPPESPTDEKTVLLEKKIEDSVKMESPEEEEDEQLKDDWAESDEEVKESWDQEDKAYKEKVIENITVPKPPVIDGAELEEEDEEEEETEEENEESESEEDSEDESESDDDLTPKEKALLKIQKRQVENEKKRTTDVLRAPVVCVLGHVDTGKTKILDKLRRTNVQDGEAGGITQQIGATNVPVQAILDQTKMCKEFQKLDLRLPGLLIIDTPGHESFSNLRSRGSSLCDIAILVVDIMHGLEPQTIESINLLKQRKTPFIVALNKVDRLFQWKTSPHTDVVSTIKKQAKNTKDQFDELSQQVILQFAEQGLNTALFYENKNRKEFVSMVPTSAHSGDGMGNLLALICELTQTMLAKKISYSEELQATVMEVKALPGLGTTIDVILVNGRLKEGATIVLAGQDGPIVTQIRGLLMPQPMKELRVKNQYMKYKVVPAAQGVKVIAKDLDKSLAGLPLYVAHDQDEIEILKDDVSVQLKNVLNAIKLKDRGVYVQASTLGSMEALLEFLRTSKIPYAGINIGPVHKKDVMKSSTMLEHDEKYAVILAFDVKIERDAQDLAENLGVTIFSAEIIYHLFDKFTQFQENLKKKKKDQFGRIAVFPCKLRVLPQFIFNSRDPIVVGVSIEDGILKIGAPLCVPSKEFVEIGHVSSIELNHKPQEFAKKGQEVCIKIEPCGGEAPKMFGRHFEHTDIVMSKISRESIDALKDYFRDEMGKSDWQLIVELKKIFKIM